MGLRFLTNSSSDLGLTLSPTSASETLFTLHKHNKHHLASPKMNNRTDEAKHIEGESKLLVTSEVPLPLSFHYVPSGPFPEASKWKFIHYAEIERQSIVFSPIPQPKKASLLLYSHFQKRGSTHLCIYKTNE